MKEQIASVIKTLQELEIKASYKNLSCLLGCIQTLADIVAELDKEGGEKGV